MSEKKTSAEIEDVLSSIRRLVSDELRVPEGQARPTAPEKLILTPAQRVDHSADDAPAADPLSDVLGGGSAGLLSGGADAGAHGDGGGDDEPAIGLAGRFAALRAVVADRRLAAEGDRAGAAASRGAEGQPPVVPAEVPEAAIWIEGEDDDWVEDWSEEAWAEPETADFIAFPTPVTPAGAEVVVLHQPVRSDDPSTAGESAAPLQTEDSPGADTAAADAPLDAVPADTAGASDLSGVLVLERPLFGGLGGGHSLQPADMGHELYPEAEPDTTILLDEPVREELAPGEPTTDEIVAEIEAEIEAEIAASVAAAAVASAAASPGVVKAAAPGEDDRVIAELDEDQLRILVRGMIKSELQGELGERITRNIRKMLRAEITRALSAHGLT